METEFTSLKNLHYLYEKIFSLDIIMDQFLQVFFFYLIFLQDRERKKIADQPRASLLGVNFTNQLLPHTKLQNGAITCNKILILGWTWHSISPVSVLPITLCRKTQYNFSTKTAHKISVKWTPCLQMSFICVY